MYNLALVKTWTTAEKGWAFSTGFIRLIEALKHPRAWCGVRQLRIAFVRSDISEEEEEEEDGDEQYVLEMLEGESLG